MAMLASGQSERSGPDDGVAPVMVAAQALHFGYPGLALWSGASHSWPAGLCLVRGDEGSGKTSLLRVLAGQLPLQGGQLRHREGRAPSLFWQDPRAGMAEVQRELPVLDWVQAQRQAYPHWDESAWDMHVQGLGLAPHLHKRLLALSTGSLRKLWMAAGWSSGAQLLLIDEPLAALDRGSIEHVQQALARLSWAGQRAAVAQGRPPRCVIVAHWDAMQGVAWDDVVDLDSP